MIERNNVKQTVKMEMRDTRVNGRPRLKLMGNIRHAMNKLGLEEEDAKLGKYGYGRRRIGHYLNPLNILWHIIM